MPRLPYAALRLVQDIQAIKPNAKAKPHGDFDGYQVYRTIKFGKRESELVHRILSHIEDERIESAHLTDAGYLHVTFSPKPIADYRYRFHVREAAEVVRAEDQADGGQAAAEMAARVAEGPQEE